LQSRAVALLLFASAVPVAINADVINFETFPDHSAIANSTVLASQFPGFSFTNTIVLTAGIGVNEFEAPPHSGVNEASDNGGAIVIDFTSPITDFSGYFTYYVPLTLTAFDAGHVEVDSAASAYSINVGCDPGSPPTCLGDPESSPNELLSLHSSAGISEVTILGDPGGGSFTLDDLAFSNTVSAVPEPASLLLLLSVLGAAGAVRKRHS
jgi:hypothetical protein